MVIFIQTMKMMLPKYIYKISNHDKTTSMICRHKNTSYNVGFLFKQLPIHIISSISEDSKVEIADVKSNKEILLRIEKKININKLSCKVTYEDFAKYLSRVFVDNVGGIVVYDIFNEDRDEFLLDSKILEPHYDSNLVVNRLNDMMK